MTDNKAKLLEDYIDLDPLAEELERHPRTVIRWTKEPDGLPYTRLGNRTIFHIPTTREWIFKRMRRPNARRAREVEPIT